jgi:hypothetical protein
MFDDVMPGTGQTGSNQCDSSSNGDRLARTRHSLELKGVAE